MVEVHLVWVPSGTWPLRHLATPSLTRRDRVDSNRWRQPGSVAKVSPADVRTTRREDLHPFLVAMGRGLIDDVPVAVLTFAGSDLVNVNAEWTAMSGLSAIESVGDGWLTAIHPGDRAEAVLCTQPSVSAQDFEGDFRLLQVDGIDCWVRARSRPSSGSPPAGAASTLIRRPSPEQRSSAAPHVET